MWSLLHFTDSHFVWKTSSSVCIVCTRWMWPCVLNQVDLFSVWLQHAYRTTFQAVRITDQTTPVNKHKLSAPNQIWPVSVTSREHRRVLRHISIFVIVSANLAGHLLELDKSSTSRQLHIWASRQQTQHLIFSEQHLCNWQMVQL